MTISKKNVIKAKHEMMERFDCDEVGTLREYVGCKTDYGSKKKVIEAKRKMMERFDCDEVTLDAKRIKTGRMDT